MIKKIVLRIFLMFIAVFIAMSIAFFSYSYYMSNITYDVLNLDEFLNIGLKLYRNFLELRVLGGDWGYSRDGELMIEIMLPRFLISMKYILYTMIVFLPAGIGFGIYFAYNDQKRLTNILSKISLIMGHIPTYLIFIYMVIIFGYQLNLLPLSWPFVYFGFNTKFEGLIIPIVTLATYPTAILANNLSAELKETFNKEYFTLSRAKGLTKLQSILRHSLRPSLVSMMPIITHLLIFIIGSSFLVEVLYFIPGIGIIFFEALIQIDPDFETFYLNINIPSVILITTYYMFLGLCLVALSDVAMYFIDPRIKHTSRRTIK